MEISIQLVSRDQFLTYIGNRLCPLLAETSNYLHNLCVLTKTTTYYFEKKSLTGSEREYRHDGRWRTPHVPRAVCLNNRKQTPPGRDRTGARKFRRRSDFRARSGRVTHGAWRSTPRQRRPRNRPGHLRQSPFGRPTAATATSFISPHHSLARAGQLDQFRSEEWEREGALP